jgi:hypothetical protein
MKFTYKAEMFDSLDAKIVIIFFCKDEYQQKMNWHYLGLAEKVRNVVDIRYRA